ncbi:MAG: hypothetical protein JST54_19365 [Deltaproteobacteria bacterium]|nr:hypothetical protein [Deltaproteobacteria bacterium]
MKVCPSCLGEFRDEAEQCDACLVPLVSEAEGREIRGSLPSPRPGGPGFVTVATTTDPFEAEAFVAAVREAGIPTFSRARRRAMVDVLVTPGASSFWEVLAPADKLQPAQAAINARKQELDAEADAAAKAAEEEEAATEDHVVVGETESEQVAARWAQALAAAGISAVLRARQDVELDPADPTDPPATLLLVPTAQADKARDVIKGQ